MKKETKRTLAVLFKGIWLYSLLIWGYIAVENLFYPSAVATQALSIYIPIKQNLLAIWSFVVSLAAFILWSYFS